MPSDCDRQWMLDFPPLRPIARREYTDIAARRYAILAVPARAPALIKGETQLYQWLATASSWKFSLLT